MRSAPSGENRLLWITATNNLSDGLRVALFQLLAITLTADSVTVSALAMMGGAQWLVGGALSGWLVDRFRRILLIRVVNGVRVAVAAMLCGRWMLGELTMLDLLVVAGVLGLAEVIVDNATQAVAAEGVPGERRARVAGRLVAIQTVGQELLGPAIAGFLQAFSPIGSLATLVALFLPGMLTPLPEGEARPRRVAGEAQGSTGSAVRAGLRELRGLIALGVTYSIADAMMFSIFVLYVRDVLQRSEQWFGLLLSVGAVGAISGGWIVDRTLRHLASKTQCVALALGAVTHLGLASTSSVAVAALTTFFSGLAIGTWNATSLVRRQLVIPSAIFGQVNGLFQSIVIGAAALGALAGGLVARIWSLQAAIAIGGVLLSVAAVVAFWVSVFSERARRLDRMSSP